MNNNYYYLLGIMVACGRMNELTTSVYVKPNLVTDVKYHIPAEVQVSETLWQKDPEVIRLSWKTNSDFPVDASVLYASAEELWDKRVPKEVLDLDEPEKLKMFLHGFIEGNAYVVNNDYVLRISSPQLVSDLINVLDSLHIHYVVRTMDQVKILSFEADARPKQEQRKLTVFEINIDQRNKYL